MAEYEHITHEFDPVCYDDSRILILGSVPSVKSRQASFYYAHPQNRFWRVLAAVYGVDVPSSIEEKKAMLRTCHVALWDVVAECDIKGSSDASIRNVVANDVRGLIEGAEIGRIFVNGKAAEKMYNKMIFEQTGIKAEVLPSTSPANAVWTLEKLVAEWKSKLLSK